MGFFMHWLEMWALTIVIVVFILALSASMLCIARTKIEHISTERTAAENHGQLLAQGDIDGFLAAPMLDF